MSLYEVVIIKEGYSYMLNGVMKANGTCTLLKGPLKILVDTLSPWDKDDLVRGLLENGIACDAIDFVVCTHGHVDHIGNLNLFPNARHVVGFSVCFKDEFYIHPFETGEPYVIDQWVKVVPTPGHTLSDVSVVVSTAGLGVVVAAGDLFEKEEDLTTPSLWREAGSENPTLQMENRNKVFQMADHIIPGHGGMFKVTEFMKQYLILQ